MGRHASTVVVAQKYSTSHIADVINAKLQQIVTWLARFWVIMSNKIQVGGNKIGVHGSIKFS